MLALLESTEAEAEGLPHIVEEWRRSYTLRVRKRQLHADVHYAGPLRLVAD